MRGCVYCNVERRTANLPMLWHPQQTFEDNFVGFCESPFRSEIFGAFFHYCLISAQYYNCKDHLL